jgi:D-glycero-alpha-D-manno-heptose 1-phosphate guanylyltransferase
MDSHVLFVLVGGFGSRLRSVVSDVPKPLAPVQERPFLYFQVKNWANQGIRSFVFLLYNQSDKIIDFIEGERNGLFKSCEVKYLVEPQPMGTGGAIALAIQQLKFQGVFLMTNADTWLGSGMNHISNSESPTIAVVSVDECGRYGSVQINDNYINLFKEKASDSGVGWINAGLSKFDANIFDNWDGKPFSLEEVILPSLAAQGKLQALKLETDFIDIGIPADYQLFCEWANTKNLIS